MSAIIAGFLADKKLMQEQEIRELLESALPETKIDLALEGNKLSLRAVGSIFADLNRVKRQQLVYGVLNEKIASGELHAVSMLCQTPEEAAG